MNNNHVFNFFKYLSKSVQIAIFGWLLGTMSQTWADGLPNIVFILADDIGWGDIGPYKIDSSKVPTPNIDKLANEGMIFSDAHTPSAVCAPSRYSALTGNYPYRGRSRWGVWAYNAESQILPGQKTVADVLKAAGYKTAFMGKWHLGGDFYLKGSDRFYRGDDPAKVDFSRRMRNGPLDHGFDYSLLLPSGLQSTPYAYFADDLYTPINPQQEKIVFWPAGSYGNSVIGKDGYGDPNWDSSETGLRLAQKAVDFINVHVRQNQQNGTDTPFLLYYATQAAHGPLSPPDFFDGIPVKRTTGHFYTDMVYELDLQIGKIIQAIEEQGLTQNTLIIVTSDNGAISMRGVIANGHDPVGNLQGEKDLVYEGGHRVPFIVKWGDGTVGGSTIYPGSVNNQFISIQDWVATMYALTGQPKEEDQALDSANLLPLLLGENNLPVRSSMIVDASPGRNIHKRWSSIRDGKWKLLIDKNNRASELYDLANDILETNNLIDYSDQSWRVFELLDLYNISLTGSTTVPSLELEAIQQLVSRFYSLVLQRKPEAEGRIYWIEQLSSGTQSMEEVAINFFFSNEFINKNHDDSHFVDIAYQAILDHTAEPSGKDYWLMQLASGLSRFELIDRFIDSQEFRAWSASYGF